MIKKSILQKRIPIKVVQEVLQWHKRLALDYSLILKEEAQKWITAHQEYGDPSYNEHRLEIKNKYITEKTN